TQMRNLIDNMQARHFIVLSVALMLVLGGVSAAFANRDGEQARKEDSLEAEALAADDLDDDDDTNGDTRLSRLDASPSATGSPSAAESPSAMESPSASPSPSATDN